MASVAGQNITGLASGLDTASIVNALMAVEARPQVLLKQRQAVEQARQQALTDVKTRIGNLQTAVNALKDAGTWADVQSVESSDTTKLTVTRTAGAAAGAFQIGITSLARAEQYKSATLAGGITSGGTLTLGVGSSSISVDVTAGASLDTVASAINGSSGTPVYASVVDNQLVVSSRTTGAASTIAIGGTGALTAELGFTRSITSADASYTLDGVPKTSSSNTVTDALAGLQLVLKGSTGSAVTVSVGAPAPNTSAIQSKIQDFVTQYNSTLDFIKGKLDEKRVASPQNASERAKGVLNGDTALTGLLAQMRSAVADVFTGRPSTMKTLSQAGLSTGSGTGKTTSADALDGKLTLDTAKLSAALTTSLTDVKALFTNATGDYKTQGLSQRLATLVGNQLGANGIMTSRITSSTKQIDTYTSGIADWDTRLALRQKALNAKFTAMESALSQAQSQGSWLTGQINSLASSR